MIFIESLQYQETIADYTKTDSLRSMRDHAIRHRWIFYRLTLNGAGPNPTYSVRGGVRSDHFWKSNSRHQRMVLKWALFQFIPHKINFWTTFVIMAMSKKSLFGPLLYDQRLTLYLHLPCIEWPCEGGGQIWLLLKIELWDTQKWFKKYFFGVVS